MRSYSFKLYDKQFIQAADKWMENGYSIRGMVEELLAKYEGLEVPKPNDIQQVNIEMRELRKDVDKMRKDVIDTTEILISLIEDIELLKAEKAILLQSDPNRQNLTSFPVATG